jgi:hypothetical protein
MITDKHWQTLVGALAHICKNSGKHLQCSPMCQGMFATVVQMFTMFLPSFQSELLVGLFIGFPTLKQPFS